jgi:hypothetical protein
MSDIGISTQIVLVPKRKMLRLDTTQPEPLNIQSYIAQLTIGTAKITTAMIQDLAVTNAKIDSLVATKITGQIVDAQILSVEWAKIANVVVTNAQIESCSITKLTAGNLTVLITITTGSLSAAAGAVILDSTGLKIVGQAITFCYGTTIVGYIWGFGAAQFCVTAATDKNLFVGASTGQLFLTASGAYPITLSALSLDGSGCLYFDVPRRTSAPIAVEGRMYYQYSGVTRFYGYSAGAWHLLDYP